MRRQSVIWACILLAVGLFGPFGPALAQQQEKRIALVIGNGAYAKSPLATAANDGGLIAQTLQAAGFDVVGARDLDGDTLRRSFRDFVQKAQSSGPDTVAMVYLAGYGLQLAGENYFIPVDSAIGREIQSSAFLNWPGSEWLYSGVETSTTSASRIAARSASTAS